MSYPAYPECKDPGVRWLGEVPKHWEIAPLKSQTSYNDEVLSEKTPEDFLLQYVEIADVDSTEGIVRSTEYPFAQAPSRARRVVRDGDVLISTVRTYLRAIAPVQTPPKNMVASTGFAVVRPSSDGLSGGFLGYLLRAEWLISEIISRSVGVSYPAIGASELMGLKAPVPSPAEQTQIARFLDHQTARIDALIAEQQRLIELLKEKRQTVVSHAVTKGLDPDVAMKDSGVEWLGKVPAHWEVSQAKYLAAPGTSITYGIVQAGPEYPGGISYIRTSDMSGEELPIEGYAHTSPEIDRSYQRSKVKADDIIVAIRATIGKCLLVPHELEGANLTQGTAKISPRPDTRERFLLNYLKSTNVQTYFSSKAKGATFKEITLDVLRRTPVLIPPVQEQVEIEHFAREHSCDLSSLIDTGFKAISLLRERRSALISAAVTGKIDVRDWEPPVSETFPRFTANEKSVGMSPMHRLRLMVYNGVSSMNQGRA